MQHLEDPFKDLGPLTPDMTNVSCIVTSLSESRDSKYKKYLFDGCASTSFIYGLDDIPTDDPVESSSTLHLNESIIEKIFEPGNNTSVELEREGDSALEPEDVKSSTPVKQDPLFGLCGSPVQSGTRLDCPLYKFGNDYAPPELLIPSRFPNISPKWFANHQPLGMRDELFVSIVRRRINPNDVLHAVGGHSQNAPYIMSYIRIFQMTHQSGSHSQRDRRQLDYYSLVYSSGGSTKKNADETLQVDDSNILRYQLAHPIFIPRCLAWIDADAFSSSTRKFQILGKSLTFSIR